MAILAMRNVAGGPSGWGWSEATPQQGCETHSSICRVRHKRRALHAQREILRRGQKTEMAQALANLAADATAPPYGRVAALFTLKQLDGKQSHRRLLKLADDKTVREFVLRALTDRKAEASGLEAGPFVAALADESPRVRAQALVSLSRLNAIAAAKSIIPLTARPDGSAMPTKRPAHAQPDPDRVVPHLAVRALVTLGAVEACLEALDGPHRPGRSRRCARCTTSPRSMA